MRTKKTKLLVLALSLGFILISKPVYAHSMPGPLSYLAVLAFFSSFLWLPFIAIWIFREIKNKKSNDEIIKSQGDVFLNSSIEEATMQKGNNILKAVLAILLYIPIIFLLALLLNGGNINSSQKIILTVIPLVQALVNFLIIVYLLDISIRNYSSKLNVIFWSLAPLVVANFFAVLFASEIFSNSNHFPGSGFFNVVACFFGILTSTLSVWYLFAYSLKYVNRNSDFIWVLSVIPYVFSSGAKTVGLIVFFRIGFSILFGLWIFFIVISISSAVRSRNIKYKIFSLIGLVLGLIVSALGFYV